MINHPNLRPALVDDRIRGKARFNKRDNNGLEYWLFNSFDKITIRARKKQDKRLEYGVAIGGDKVRYSVIFACNGEVEITDIYSKIDKPTLIGYVKHYIDKLRKERITSPVEINIGQ